MQRLPRHAALDVHIDVVSRFEVPQVFVARAKLWRTTDIRKPDELLLGPLRTIGDRGHPGVYVVLTHERLPHGLNET